MSWHLRDLTAATGAPIGEGPSSGFVFEARATQHVVYVGAVAGNLHVHELWKDGHGWHHNDLTKLTGAPVASNAGNGYVFRCTLHVVSLATAPGSVTEFWWDSHGWHYADLGQASGTVIDQVTGGTFGYAFPERGTQHVLFIGIGGPMYEYWWDKNVWRFNNLGMSATGATAPSSNLTGYVFEAQGTQHATYVDTNSHISELWWDSSSGWHWNDLTAATAAPQAQWNRNAPGYVFPSQGTQHVNYVGVDNHIHELWRDGSGWHHNDLTAATGGPNSQSEPSGYMFAGTQHVNYLGNDDHIHELWWDTAGWHDNDLTSAVGGPPSLDAEPKGYAFEAQGSQHVIYTDDSGHVIELHWTP
jgi:hypothetical protein